MSIRMTRTTAVMIAVGLLAISAGIAYWWSRHQHSAPASMSAAADRKVLYWYDPMAPQERYPGPGTSSMGMTLIPKYADGERSEGVVISAQTRQNIGLRTTLVTRGSLRSAVTAPGTVTWDLRQERVVSVPVDAIVERLYLKAPFDAVTAGQPLARVIAREWSTALAETRALRSAGSPAARELGQAAGTRLRLLGLPAAAHPGLAGTVVMTAPVSGVVSEIGVREGQSAGAGTQLFRINGIDTVWLEASIPQGSIGDIARGTPVTATVTSRPGKTFTGRVEALLPQLDPTSRSQKARIVLDNPNHLLAPGMFALVALAPVDSAEFPLVPTNALIDSGTQTRVIAVGLDGSLVPVAVRTGRSAGGQTEVLEGLRGGERVVTSGQFLIDSEANLTGALERLAPVMPPTSPGDASDGAGAGGEHAGHGPAHAAPTPHADQSHDAEPAR